MGKWVKSVANKSSRPFTRKTSRKSKRIVRAKPKTATKNLTMVNIGLGFPKKIMMTHRYHSNIQLNSVAGTQFTYNFSANGLFDPDITAAGHQPLYFDQISTLYDGYVVIGSKIRCRVTNAALVNNACNIALIVNDDVVVTPSSDGIFEQSLERNRTIPAGSPDVHTLTGKYSAKKYFGGSILANNALQGSVVSNPLEGTFYTIVGFCPFLGTTTLNVEVMIEYVAIWTELRDIASS